MDKIQLIDTLNPENITDDLMLSSLPSYNSLWMLKDIKPLSSYFFYDIDFFDIKNIIFIILKNILKETIPNKELYAIIDKSFDFDTTLHKLCDNKYILELFHGPTLTFKDYGARFLAQTIQYLKKDQTLYVIVSTSGDTGSAIADAFEYIKDIVVIILYPKDKISLLQKEQITKYGHNVIVFEVDGTFDDCQNMAKHLLIDDLGINTISANSINILRLIPQVVYYFFSYKLLNKEKRKKKLIYSVPSGNLGNLTAGLIAKKLGLPIELFISAQNSNDTFHKYLETGKYIPQNTKRTISNSMDVGNPSNFKRILYLYKNNHNAIKHDIISETISDDKTLDIINEVYDKYNYIIDPHTAVGYGVIDKLNLIDNDCVYIILSTAHPIKFKEVIDNDIIKENIKTPNQIHELKYRIGCYLSIRNYYPFLRKLIKSKLHNNPNIVFIGMPRVGKSTIGKLLSINLYYNFIDLDLVIEGIYGKIETLTDTDSFLKIEETIAKMVTNKFNTIISPGGSIIYSEEAINYLRYLPSIIIYLELSYDKAYERICHLDINNSNIYMNRNETYRELYNERVKLYEKYCDYKICCDKLNKGMLLKEIINIRNLLI